MRHTAGPVSLCRWSIHYRPVCYERIPSPPPSLLAHFDLEDENSWPEWRAPHASMEFTDRLTDGLETSAFSNVGLDELPIGLGQITRAVQSSPEELLEEALGFSIMGRNEDLVADLLEKINLKRSQPKGLYPFHLAASYLDGSRTCCNILDRLLKMFPDRQLYINDLGHTVLDNLMTTILKAHTSCRPSVADTAFEKGKRFEGEDVDICGRWDPDSECIHRLLANGKSSIPFEWKHMFCHTSVQAVCHAIGAIFCPTSPMNVDTPSGLFMRRCGHCGLKLQLRPLHTLVVVGLHLSQSGCEGETLFGIIACLLCLLSKGANPILKAHILLQGLLGSDESTECSHEELDPVELIKNLPVRLTSAWPQPIRRGWQVFSNILKHSQAEWQGKSSQEEQRSHDQQQMDNFDTLIDDDEDMETDRAGSSASFPLSCVHEEDGPEGFVHDNFFGESKVLATLWAAVQTEFLTYRRLKEGDPWISQNFNMQSLDEGLQNNGAVDIPLVAHNMMKAFSGCGTFDEVEPACAIADDVSAYYFSNLDDWDRTTFICIPARWEYYY